MKRSFIELSYCSSSVPASIEQIYLVVRLAYVLGLILKGNGRSSGGGATSPHRDSGKGSAGAG